MNRVAVGVLAAFLIMAVPSLWAADWKHLEGTYALTAQNYLDPSEDEPLDSHVRFQLGGRTARDLFRAMKVAEKPDDCTGAMVKEIGEMRCYSYGNAERYACDFSLDLARQTIEYGVAC